jgi:Xaa-Pro dipeptidase
MNRRLFIVTAAAGAAELARTQRRSLEPANVPDVIKNLKPMLDGVQPITGAERAARIEKARRLMRDNKIGAILCQGGSSLYYYTGMRANSASPTTWVLPAKGDPASFEPEAGAVPYQRIAEFLKSTAARVGIEERTPFSVLDGLRKQLPAAEFVSADPVTDGCRVIKSPAEIALLQRANDITIAAYRAAFQTLREGMTQGELSANIAAAYRALGVQGDAMAIFGKYTAFPHGSIQPQQLREGDMVLIDDGCSVEGYQSDITRTTVFGKPTMRQTEIWNLERKAQDAALAAAKPGAACESVDAAARKVITDAGFGPGYKVPGLPHRTGHGIGLDGHEWTYLVKGNRTQLQPGMCFSDEPTIAIYGEFGVRLEDCMYITPDGARMFTKQSPAIDQPFG